MKKLLKITNLPWFTLVASVAALLLSARFYNRASGTGELLNHRHPAGIALLVLCGIVLLLLFLASRMLPKEGKLEELLPAAPIRGIGCFIGTVGIAISCILMATATDFMTILSLLLGIVAGVCLLFVGSQRMFKMQPHYVFYGLITLFFMILGLVRCRQWGAETQIMWYFFSLLAQVFLLLTVFQCTSVCANGKNARLLIFFSNAAVLFCCAAFPARNDPFFLTCAIWLMLDCCFFKLPVKE